MDVARMLKKAQDSRASDIFIVAGRPLSFKLNESIVAVGEARMTPAMTEASIREIYALGDRSMDRLLAGGDDDFSFSMPELGRFRCNTYKQRGSLAAVLRVVAFSLPEPEEMNIPQAIVEMAKREKGLVLVTGSAGSGKTTTLACMIDYINKTRNNHIITIEDPIEYIHRHNLSIVSQREIENDTIGYVEALRAALRQAPDVILLGEMRDFETIATAMTAAETGQLVLSTLHTVGAANTIDRIIDVFPENQQQQIRVQLSMVLQAVVSQQLVPRIGGGMIPAFEVMVINPAISNMIREGKVHQLDNAIFSGSAQGMMAMDGYLLKLVEKGEITRENALLYCSNQENLKKRLAAMNNGK